MWVVLNGLMQHKSQETCAIRHCYSDIALLFKQLIQLVPLEDTERERERESIREHYSVNSRLLIIDSKRYGSSKTKIQLTTRTLSRSTSARRSFSQQQCLLHLRFATRQYSPVGSKTSRTKGQPHTSSAATYKQQINNSAGLIRSVHKQCQDVYNQHKRSFKLICLEESLKECVKSYLWVSGMLGTQNLKPFTVRFALRIVHITEQPRCTRGKKRWANSFI